MQINDILKSIKRGNDTLPNRLVLAGPMGIGKTTFASKTPDPLFICSEDGLKGFDHLERFMVTNYDDLIVLLQQFPTDRFKTVVIDTSDWLERVVCQHICKVAKCDSIEEYGGGYGKGFTELERLFVVILTEVDRLRTRGVGSVILAHTHTKVFTNPEGQTWDRYEMKGQKKVTGVLGEWADAVLFATYEVFKIKTKGERKEKSVGGERIMHTTWSPAWDAKNRLNLPETLPMDWDVLDQSIKENSVSALRAKVTALYQTAKIPDAQKPTWDKGVKNLESFTADRLKVAIEKLEALQ